jgi:hypothetical protein
MSDIRLVLVVPQGAIIATSLNIEGFARHISPGSGKYFFGRTVLFELALEGDRPAFTYLDEGSWRDTTGDTIMALQAALAGKRTKTALSNHAFSCTPIMAHRTCYLVKTGGLVQPMVQHGELMRFISHDCHEKMSPDEIAAVIGCPVPAQRIQRLYMVLSPIELIVISNLTPPEYAWYSTHRPGKVFRQVLFTEIREELHHLAAQSHYIRAREELALNPRKKTKTIIGEDCINRVLFSAWVGYKQPGVGGLYIADRERIHLWEFPSELEERWEKAEG